MNIGIDTSTGKHLTSPDAVRSPPTSRGARSRASSLDVPDSGGGGGTEIPPEVLDSLRARLAVLQLRVNFPPPSVSPDQGSTDTDSTLTTSSGSKPESYNVVNCVIGGVSVRIAANCLSSIGLLGLLEQSDRKAEKGHLLKRTVMLTKVSLRTHSTVEANQHHAGLVRGRRNQRVAA